MFSTAKQKNVNGWYSSGRFHQSVWYWWRALLSFLPVSRLTDSQILLRVIDGSLSIIASDAQSILSVEKILFNEESLNNHDWLNTTYIAKRLRCPIVFLLEPHQTLSLELTFPVDAEENLDQLFAYDIDRLTPLPSNMVYYDYQITHRDKSAGKITVVLHVVSRKELDELVRLLKETHLPLHGVDACYQQAAGFCGYGVNLLPVEHRAFLPWRGLWSSLIFTLAVACSISVGHYYSVNIKEEYIAQWTQQLDSLSQSTKTVVDLRKQVEEAEREALFIQAKKGGEQAMSGVLHRLTQSLPDNTYVQQLYIKNNTVEFHGLSDSAASLISLLEKTPWFNETILRAPITQDKTTQKERYKIRVSSNVDIINNYEHPLNAPVESLPETQSSEGEGAG
ncbi:MAG: general secretion pathway protein L [Candidatus Endobugula sp.]|jgi:general secretion pathway protein L